MGLISLVERIPRPFEILKLPYLSKLSGKFLKSSQNIAFYHLVGFLERDKNWVGRKHTSISPLELNLQQI